MYKTYKKAIAKFLVLPTMREIVHSFVAAVACRFMQDRHESRYLGSKAIDILLHVHAPEFLRRKFWVWSLRHTGQNWLCMTCCIRLSNKVSCDRDLIDY
jgi:hypothetical protein